MRFSVRALGSAPPGPFRRRPPPIEVASRSLQRSPVHDDSGGPPSSPFRNTIPSMGILHQDTHSAKLPSSDVVNVVQTGETQKISLFWSPPFPPVRGARTRTGRCSDALDPGGAADKVGSCVWLTVAPLLRSTRTHRRRDLPPPPPASRTKNNPPRPRAHAHAAQSPPFRVAERISTWTSCRRRWSSAAATSSTVSDSTASGRSGRERAQWEKRPVPRLPLHYRTPFTASCKYISMPPRNVPSQPGAEAHPPLLLSSRGPNATALAGELGWEPSVPFVSPETLPTGVLHVPLACEAVCSSATRSTPRSSHPA